jgi:hypothetical protein
MYTENVNISTEMEWTFKQRYRLLSRENRKSACLVARVDIWFINFLLTVFQLYSLREQSSEQWIISVKGDHVILIGEMMDRILNLCLEKDHQGTLLTNCCSKRTGHQRILLTKTQFKVVFRVQNVWRHQRVIRNSKSKKNR